ncbi:MAG: signal peptidase I [Bacillota bacterium]|nr:signal peptidase I [Bacillota bacterium]
MIRRIMLYVCAAVLGIMCAAASSCAFTTAEVAGNGMEPAISSGSRVLINKLAYRKSGAVPETGNLIAFYSDVYSEEGEGRILVRRVAGASGDTVEIKDDIFYLNGSPYTEFMSEAAHMDDLEKITLGDDEIFVLSDNRKSAMDSRNEAIGILAVQDCIGKVCFE